jgi:hypothetical protein
MMFVYYLPTIQLAEERFDFRALQWGHPATTWNALKFS